MAEYKRAIEYYKDVAGKSDVLQTFKELARTDQRAMRAIDNRMDLLRQVDLKDALGTPLLKQPTATIYVLRVQSGSVSYRLPFFVSPCHDGKLVVLTHSEHRSLLRGDRYKRLIEAAERRREDWIRRNCDPNQREEHEHG